jgi:hypothetical protein
MPVTRVTGRNIRDGDLTDVDVAGANKDGAAGVPSLRTLGTGPQQAAAGDDARFPTFVDEEVPSGTIDGRNTVFTLASTPAAGTLDVFLRGVRLREGTSNDYTLSGTTLTFSTRQTPRPGDNLIVKYRV